MHPDQEREDAVEASVMTELPHHIPGDEAIRSALEAASGVFVKLESIQAKVGHAAGDVATFRSLNQAIELIGKAISELRSVDVETSSPLAPGFVVDWHRTRSGDARRTRHSKPRHTPPGSTKRTSASQPQRTSSSGARRPLMPGPGAPHRRQPGRGQ